jgi:hypothetical protein
VFLGVFVGKERAKAWRGGCAVFKKGFIVFIYKRLLFLRAFNSRKIQYPESGQTFAEPYIHQGI